MSKVEIPMDTINSATARPVQLLNNPELYHKIEQIAGDLKTITGAVAGARDRWAS